MYWLLVLIIVLIIIILSMGVLLTIILFKYMISTYFRQQDNISYSSLIKCIQSVSENNYFMNYGYWTPDTKCLKEANQNLTSRVLSKAKVEKDHEILDVGCGYGIQDFYWLDKLSRPDNSSSTTTCNVKITAIDIAETQINYANRLRKLKDIPKEVLRFRMGDAHDLISVVQSKKFDRIISQESAFHYKDRALFFRNVSETLKDKGLFVITDILLQDTQNLSLSKRLFINMASEFLAIPSQNMITPKEWKESLCKNNLEIVEFEDLTDVTFKPYYSNFILPYILKNNMNKIIQYTAPSLFKHIQPFAYVMAVCKKK